MTLASQTIAVKIAVKIVTDCEFWLYEELRFMMMTMTAAVRAPAEMRTAVELRWGKSCWPAPPSRLSPRSLCCKNFLQDWKNILQRFFSGLKSLYLMSFKPRHVQGGLFTMQSGLWLHWWQIHTPVLLRSIGEKTQI